MLSCDAIVDIWMCFVNLSERLIACCYEDVIGMSWVTALFFMVLIWRRFLLGKFADMQTFAGESMTAEGGMAFGYYKEGAHSPTFAYISKAMEAEKVGYR